MVLQEKEGSTWEAHITQIPPMHPWRHVSMVGELLGDLLSSGQLDVCQGQDYSDNYQIAPNQVSRFCSGLHPGWCKIGDIHETPHRSWFLREIPHRIIHKTRQKISMS